MEYQATAKVLGNNARVEIRVVLDGGATPIQQQNFALVVFC
jgi:hypothetical protein